jgi:hypothetical protein
LAADSSLPLQVAPFSDAGHAPPLFEMLQLSGKFPENVFQSLEQIRSKKSILIFLGPFYHLKTTANKRFFKYASLKILKIKAFREQNL